MAADPSGRLEAIEAKANQLESEARSAKATGRLVTIVVAVVILIMLYVALRPVVGLYQNPEPVVTALSERMEQRLQPMVMDELQTMQQDLVPVYREAVNDVMEQRRADIMVALDSQTTQLYQDVRMQLEERLTNFSQDLAERQYNRLIEEFPEIEELDTETDPNRPGVTKAQLIIGALDPVSQRLAIDLFENHFIAISRLENEFQAFETPTTVSNMTDQELRAYATELATNYVATRLEQMQSGDVPIDETTAVELEIDSRP
jgi:hypothetical protein